MLKAARQPGVGDGTEETARVRVARPGQERGSGALLDDSAGVHDGDAVGDRPDHREVMRHVHNRDAALAAKTVDLLQDVGLCDHVEPGRRLVEDDDSGSQTSALAIATRCCWPPEYWRYRRAKAYPTGNLTEARARATSPPCCLPWAFTMSPMRPSTRAGLSASPGSWAT